MGVDVASPRIVVDVEVLHDARLDAGADDELRGLHYLGLVLHAATTTQERWRIAEEKTTSARPCNDSSKFGGPVDGTQCSAPRHAFSLKDANHPLRTRNHSPLPH